MNEILELIEGYGLPLVLLLGSLYALYRFFFFSIIEVKSTFSKHHEKNAENMEEIKKKIDIILEFIKHKKQMSKLKKRKNKICPAGIAWAKRTFDRYPSAYANMAASKYCKDPNYAKGAKGKKKKK